MPGSIATKPGDVVVASNGKSIQIDNTDAEGRLILADALHYASQFKPRAMIDMATLTGTTLFFLHVDVFCTIMLFISKKTNLFHSYCFIFWRSQALIS